MWIQMENFSFGRILLLLKQKSCMAVKICLLASLLPENPPELPICLS